ncbi:MAG: hypothetical protein BroJett015_23100 [Chloroflexota bacterium]|nr:hypothetical protein [Ardenticatenaceae bacterium]GIK56647.1 MAG: hypothetical protein BroJett015_23100 [Chloroflexota bacterium]
MSNWVITQLLNYLITQLLADMRFIVHEQPYEKPIAAGRLRYERDGRATGAVESWRLTQAVEGYEVLRVDLDARPAESEHSYLYHLVRRADKTPERLSYRFWGDDLMIEGTVLLEDTVVTNTRTVNGTTYTDDVELEPGYGFWFPSSVGLGLLAGFGGGTAVTLESVSSEQLAVSSERVSAFGLQVVAVVVAGERPLTIRWLENERRIWLDEHGWVVKMRRGDGLTAVETRAIWY